MPDGAAAKAHGARLPVRVGNSSRSAFLLGGVAARVQDSADVAAPPDRRRHRAGAGLRARASAWRWPAGRRATGCATSCASAQLSGQLAGGPRLCRPAAAAERPPRDLARPGRHLRRQPAPAGRAGRSRRPGDRRLATGAGRRRRPPGSRACCARTSPPARLASPGGGGAAVELRPVYADDIGGGLGGVSRPRAGAGARLRRRRRRWSSWWSAGRCGR